MNKSRNDLVCLNSWNFYNGRGSEKSPKGNLSVTFSHFGHVNGHPIAAKVVTGVLKRPESKTFLRMAWGQAETSDHTFSAWLSEPKARCAERAQPPAAAIHRHLTSWLSRRGKRPLEPCIFAYSWVSGKEMSTTAGCRSRVTSTEEPSTPRRNVQWDPQVDAVPPVAAAGCRVRSSLSRIYKHRTVWTALLATNHAKEGWYLRVRDNWVRRKGKQMCVQFCPDTESLESTRAVSCRSCDPQAVASLLLSLL